MPDLLTNSLIGLKAAQTRVKVTQENITKTQVEGAHRVDPETSYNGKTGGIDVILKRAEDPFLQKLFSQSITTVNNTAVIQDGLTFLQSTITDPQQSNKSKLIGSVEKFINSARQIVGNPNPALKQAFVAQGENLAKTISDTTNKILDLRLQADQDLNTSLISANNFIAELFHLNLSMSKSGNSAELLDQRDSLINKISEFFDIKVSFGINNNALVSTADGSLNLVDSTTYARFNYNPLIGKEAFLQEQVNLSSITMDHVTSNGKVVANFTVVEGSDTSISKIESGKIGGYIKLRDVVLPEAGQAIGKLASQVMNTINAVHNKYSPFPPQTTLTSTKEVLYNDFINWNGTLTIAATTKDGNYLEGNANSGAVRPITIDLQSLPTAAANNGVATIKDMIDEINAYLGQGLADNRLALGVINEIPIAGGVVPPPTYLLNNIKLAGMSDVDAAGNFSFDLELDGSKYFGSKVQVLSVTGPAGQAANLPQTFDLGLGMHTRTNQQITVGGIALGPQNIDVQIRVIGDNGVVEEGTARFTIDPTLPNGTAMLNKRVVGTGRPLVAGGPGLIVATNNDTYAPIAVAKLVDENGVEVGVNSGLTGKLVIEAYNGNNGLIISSDQDDTLNGFSNFFGMNNFFEKDILPGTFKVKDAIVADPTLLSTGAPHAAGIKQTVNQGSGAPASATMVFSGAPQNGDTVTVQGVTFTFNNPLTGLVPNEVQGAITPLASYTNLINAINNHPALSSIVRADVNVVGAIATVTISSLALGSSSNLFTLAANFGAPRTVTITPAGGVPVGPLQNPASTLGGGTDAAVQIAKFGLNIGNDATDFFAEIDRLQNKLWNFEASGSVPASTTSIYGYASFITGLLSNQLTAAKADAEVAQNIQKNLAATLQDGVGIDQDTEILKLSDFAQSLQALVAVAGVASRIYKDAIDNLRTV